MKKILLTYFIVQMTICYLSAQNTSGIRFTKLGWGDVLARAKEEHKYIFVDCYATWCAPCKQMNENVFPLKSIGDVYNRYFISVRLQMDSTKLDSKETKEWYPLAAMFSKYYSIYAYPTYLFFDPEGRAVHKATGGMTVTDFITLASDARDSLRQYYRVMRAFHPGALDTTEEKGLADAYRYMDKTLAAKIALDYLSRVPISALTQKADQRLMAEFQNDTDILKIAINYISKLDPDKFKTKSNIAFIEALGRQQKVKAIATKYILQLKNIELGRQENLNLISRFRDEPGVLEAAQRYVNQLPQDSLYTPKMIHFITNCFTETPDSKGFNLFYYHSLNVDSAMKQKNYSRDQLEYVIYKTEIIPVLIKAKKDDSEPNWTKIAADITTKYNAGIAKLTINKGKVYCYEYFVDSLKENQYWPKLIDNIIELVNSHYNFNAISDPLYINNICWFYIFWHSNTAVQLNAGIRWMEMLLKSNAKKGYVLDTYACLLYKAGRIREALEWERKALISFANNNDKKNIDTSQNTIDKMKMGDKIWLGKQY